MYRYAHLFGDRGRDATLQLIPIESICRYINLGTHRFSDFILYKRRASRMHVIMQSGHTLRCKAIAILADVEILTMSFSLIKGPKFRSFGYLNLNTTFL